MNTNLKSENLNERGAGILMHITCLPSKYGIGTFGNAAIKFIDFLSQAGFKYWQVLPLGPTGYGDSPYQCFSSFAGNPYLIDLTILKNEGFLTAEDLADADFGNSPDKVDFGKLYQNRFSVLRKAFIKSERSEINEFFNTKAKHFKSGIEDYALFAAMKTHNRAPWYEQEKAVKFRDTVETEKFKIKHFSEIEFHKFVQWLFLKQWFALKEYANSKGVRIIGDLPIYSAHDSADCWVQPECFLFDENRMPTFVGGCPPDYFSADGQLWGNPLYNWRYMEETNQEWWLKRISCNLQLFDYLRLDHFRGFESFWAIPSGDLTAKNGSWKKGPGISFFKSLEKKLGHLPVIAEDLGLLDDAVLKLRDNTGYPGMKVLQFAFNPNAESEYLPHNFTTTNCVAYTGTHDNSTMQGWLNYADKQEIEFALKYLNIKNKDEFSFACIQSIVASIAKIAIAPVQDFLNLDDKARMNHPSKTGGWVWRMTEAQFADLQKQTFIIRDMLKTYGRI
ncbi:MAG: 4-alpha-glucanotransferase [Treponema sp.]|nr:MAG: 4-alpha-glucanotransferase [Treponema sp.]